MALEDAVILGRCFDKYGDVPATLARYEQARLAVTTRKVKGANDNAVRFHNPALATEAGALVSPGDFYGPDGSGYVRIAAVQPDDRIELVAKRLGV